MTLTILGLLGTLAGFGFAVWQKYFAPEVRLAKLTAERVAARAAARVEAERLKATYARIEKEKKTDAEILDRLNRPIK